MFAGTFFFKKSYAAVLALMASLRQFQQVHTTYVFWERQKKCYPSFSPFDLPYQEPLTNALIFCHHCLVDQTIMYYIQVQFLIFESSLFLKAPFWNPQALIGLHMGERQFVIRKWQLQLFNGKEYRPSYSSG